MGKSYCIDIEEVLIHLGQFGRYSIWVFSLSCVVAWMAGSVVTGDSFVAYLNPHSLDSTNLRTFPTTLDLHNTAQGWFLEQCFV
ncbi:hypothetical protein E2C01_080130 [Portunus trituberculatus]|uniref:Uncharacterized protein n=1 Tax=Portunus trituberculatus TaxID=210409 RepID=A0A5B7ILC7_PORTR|nr:hypothetical protein [Portunus trituberculatus]